MDFHAAFHPWRSLERAWTLLKQAPVSLIGAVLLLLAADMLATGIQFGFQVLAVSALDPGAALPISVGVSLLLGIAMACFSAWILVGFAGVAVRLLESGEERVGDLFETRGRWFRYLACEFLAGLLGALVFLPFGLLAFGSAFAGDWFDQELLGFTAIVLVLLIYLPIAIYVGLGLALAPLAVSIEGLGPLRALRRSWQIARGHRLWLLLYFLVQAMVAVAGLLLCCVGLIPAYALILAALHSSYALHALPAPLAGRWIDTQRASAG